MTPIQQFKRQLAAQQLLDPEVTVIVAVSTGVDSMALLTLLEQLPSQQRPQLIVAHVNHHLRAQSQTEAAYLTKYCQQHQLTLKLTDWPVRLHPKTGIEAAARQFRYTFFGQLITATQAAAVLTAHHANDQAETYLMKLARGGDLAQLVGIQAARPFYTGQLVRPLLTWSKGQLREYAQAQGVTWYEDATNADVELTRNRLRHRVVPELTQLNPAFLAHVASYEQQLQQLLMAQTEMIRGLLPTVTTQKKQLTVDAWQQLPSSWQLPVLQAWLTQGTDTQFSQLKLGPVAHWLQNSQLPTGRLPLNHDWQLTKATGLVAIQPLKKRVKKLRPVEKNMVDLNQWQKITATQVVGVFEQAALPTSQPFPLTDDDWPLQWRPWQANDLVQLKGGGHQKVRRILIDQKVPVAQRALVQVLVNAHDTVLWVVGHKFSYRQPTTATRTVFLALKHTELKGAHLKR
ncbi:tRNA lysidine(34) synthetase TilS [Lactiplantibacillus songbeiensis]|uniref:tRNA(Ile)-lysidine synthase n=1 Tax=Lactiplantibacillus songbeiensis TaxID=2559920 RepID=A0ABW4C0V8_9LACO|nr:tRNA lysidine(34) synthetase TilS [Lactiplantibacillus songbeiensis]